MPKIASISDQVSCFSSPPATGWLYMLNTPLASEVTSSRVSSAEKEAPLNSVVSKNVFASYLLIDFGFFMYVD